MTTKAHITQRASRDGVAAKTVERDYVLAHVVAAISKADIQNLVFKGGTALRLCYFEDYRYSADLDFSITGGGLARTLATIRDALTDSTGSIENLRLTNDNPPRIAYIGPLGRERSLKLDLADDELVVHTRQQLLLQHWTDLPTAAEVHVYTLLEITAEKLRCILQRLQCRDLFDIQLLLTEGVDATDAASLFEQKAAHRGLDPNSFNARYRERLSQYEKRWEAELREHIPGELPHFEETERAVTRFLRQAGLLK